ncbi:MAG TPA: hypothetical protein VMB21_12670 [Candidatus Limnocylindria bacterium]|jgi:hypothetical protein|nr:hypothetical protein [Candidatus Limnocylindria bacterium]
MKTFLICCLAACWCSVLGLAEGVKGTNSQIILGAFGVVFGVPVPSDIQIQRLKGSAENEITFKAPTPSPYLDDYVAATAPAAWVYSISGIKREPDAAKREELVERILAALKLKYGEEPGTADPSVNGLTRGDVQVVVTNGPDRVVVTYTQKTLEKLALSQLDVEKLKRSKQAVDTTGF